MFLNRSEFHDLIHQILTTTNNKVAYCKIKDGIYIGGVCATFKEALLATKQYYEEDSSCGLCITDYGSNTTEYGLSTTMWHKEDILIELGIIKEECPFKSFEKGIVNIEDKDTSVIPVGMYCYGVTEAEWHQLFDKEKHTIDITGHVKRCPYLSFKEDQPYQMNGYCFYLEAGDYEEDGTSLLWDSCKECGVKVDTCDSCGKITEEISFNDKKRMVLCNDCISKEE